MMAGEGVLIYADNPAQGRRRVQEARLSFPGSPLAVFLRTGEPSQIAGVQMVKVRPRRNRAADLAACRTKFPRVSWEVWDRPVDPAPLPVDPGGRVDVLSLIGNFPTWVEYRGHRQRNFLAKHGIRHGWTHYPQQVRLKREIEQRTPKVVLNETWMATPETVAKLADAFPAVKFVNLTHGVPGVIASHRSGEFYDFQLLAQDRANCFFGHVMREDRTISPPACKVVRLPNFLELPDGLPEKQAGGPFTVSLIARNTPDKNWGTMAAAVMEAARSMELQVLACSPEFNRSTDAHIDALLRRGIPCTVLPWKDWGTYLHAVASSADVNLTASLAESFCLIPLEHCLLGKPVITSPAVEWVPRKWQASPQDPAALAAVIKSLRAGYRRASRKARKLGRKITAENHKALLSNLNQLLNA